MATRRTDAVAAHDEHEAGEIPEAIESASGNGATSHSAPPPRKVVKRIAELRTMNVEKMGRDPFNHRVSFRAPSGAIIELQASNHSMFKDKYFQKAHRDYRNHWLMDKCWAGIKVTMPDVRLPASASGRGVFQDKKGGSFKRGAVYTTVADVHTLYWAFQDPEYIKSMASELVKRAEESWTKKNEMRVSGTRITHEERHCLAVQTPDECGNKFHTFLLMIGSSWHFTEETQWDTGDVRFNPRKARIQFKFASKNFGTKTNLKDGACFMLYPDFKALADSESMHTWLNKISNQRGIRLDRGYLARIRELTQSDEYRAAADEIVNPPDSDDSGEEDPDDDLGEEAGRERPLAPGKRSKYPGTGGGAARKKARE